MDATPAIEVRPRKFDIDDVPKHWHGGRKSVTTFLDNLSTFFPAGERFFIAAVRAHDKHVSDEALRAEVRAFCGQEGFHSREHTRYNELLAKQGYPVAELEREVQELLARVTKRAPARARLAITCALEHMTALMAHMLLADARALDGANAQMAALWKWHAAEENEHKAVAYDVYRAANGPYGLRVATMIGATAIFWWRVFRHQARMMRVDGIAYSPREWWALFRYLFVEPGTLRGVFPLYLRYFRPGFHPNEIESAHLVAKWVSEEARAAA